MRLSTAFEAAGMAIVAGALAYWVDPLWGAIVGGLYLVALGQTLRR